MATRMNHNGHNDADDGDDGDHEEMVNEGQRVTSQGADITRPHRTTYQCGGGYQPDARIPA
eukprot:9436257-Pyramimonas_sp.AAC.1